jgi:hypothetical protein
MKSFAHIIVLAVLVAAVAVPLGVRADAVRTHVLTYDLVGKEGKNDQLSYGDVARWVDWARVIYAQSGAVAAAGMKTIYYANINRVGPKDTGLYQEDESLFTHDCQGNRIPNNNPRYQRFMTDPASPGVAQRWRNYIGRLQRQSGVHFDAIFDDDAGLMEGFIGKPCNFTRAKYISDNISLIESLGVPVIFNGLSDTRRANGFGPSPEMALLSATNALGGMYEGCLYSFNPIHPLSGGDEWTILENEQLLTVAQHKLFVCNAAGTRPADVMIDQRIYVYASFLLTYDPNYSVIEEQFSVPSHLHVMPEFQLVALDPKAPQPGQVDVLRTPGGAYQREFARCYIAGSPVGACAVAVNPDYDAAHSVDLSGYHRTIVLNGSGVMDGGTIGTNGPPPPSTLGPVSGVIAFQ